MIDMTEKLGNLDTWLVTYGLYCARIYILV